MKKFLSLLLALTMVFSLAACGSTESTDPTSPVQNTSTDGTIQLSCGAAGTTSWVYSCVTAASEILKQNSNIDLVVQ